MSTKVPKRPSRPATLATLAESLEEISRQLESLAQAVEAIRPGECRLSDQVLREIHETHEVTLNLRK